MPYLVINTLDQLSSAKAAHLRQILGDEVVIKRPTKTLPNPYGGGPRRCNIFSQMWQAINGPGATSHGLERYREAADRIIAECRIPDELWQTHDVVVLFCHWSVAGLELRNGAILYAVARKKGAPVGHMCFGNRMLCDSEFLIWDLERGKLVDSFHPA